MEWERKASKYVNLFPLVARIGINLWAESAGEMLYRCQSM